MVSKISVTAQLKQKFNFSHEPADSTVYPDPETPEIDCFSIQSIERCLKFYSSMSNGGVVEWLTRRTSNLRIADRVGSNHVRGKPLFP
jgi:hypothetical protein